MISRKDISDEGAPERIHSGPEDRGLDSNEAVDYYQKPNKTISSKKRMNSEARTTMGTREGTGGHDYPELSHSDHTTVCRALSVTRPTIVRLLDAGKFPFEKPGTHRRVRLEDILTLKTARKAEQYEALEPLTQPMMKIQQSLSIV